MIKTLFDIFLFLGSEWVLWILGGCSLLCIAVIFDRRRAISAQDRVGERLWAGALRVWVTDQVPADWALQAPEFLKRYPCVEARLLNSLANRNRITTGDIEKISLSVLAAERLELERNLAILGTLGNSAPFIGLFGTVLGIIKAFSQLDQAASGSGLNSVSGGLAEALVTTAAGLLVALPSAIAFNYFQRKIKAIFSRSMSIAGAVGSSHKEERI